MPHSFHYFCFRYHFCLLTFAFCLSISRSLWILPLSLLNVAPLMKSGGSVIFSTVPWAFLLSNSSGSSQNSVGPTDRNSLPCRYQSPLLLTIILICLSLLFSPPKPQCLPPALTKQRFTAIVTDPNQLPCFLLHCSKIYFSEKNNYI